MSFAETILKICSFNVPQKKECYIVIVWRRRLPYWMCFLWAAGIRYIHVFENNWRVSIVVNHRDLSLDETLVLSKTFLNFVVIYVDSHLYQRVCLVSDSFPSIFPSCFRPRQKPQGCSVCSGHPSHPRCLWHLLL